PTASLPGKLTVADGQLRWEGAVAEGQLVVITFQAKVRGGGDGLLRNAVWGPLGLPGEQPATCETTAGQVDQATGLVCDADERLLPQLSLTKELLTAGPYTQGSTSEYRLTATNTGLADFTAAHPAVVLDDLTDVLDGALFNPDDLRVSPAGRGHASYSEPLIRWSGPLAAGDSVSLDYKVVWLADGNGSLRNVAWQPTDPGAPEAPDCDPPTGGTDPRTKEPCAVVDVARPLLSLTKTSDAHGRELATGDKVVYTVEAANSGRAPYSAEAPAVVLDDVGALRDGAVFNGDQTASVGGVPAAPPSLDPDTGLLRWEGPLEVGQTVQITFSITLTGGGSGVSRNVAWSPADPAEARPKTPACSLNGGSDLVSGEPCAADLVMRPTLLVDKSSDAAEPRPGVTVTYTVRIANTSLQDFTDENPAIVLDDMSKVLDDAAFGGVEDVEVTPSGAGQLTWNTPVLEWRGPLASGQSVLLRVKVVMGVGGDGLVRNLVWRPNNPLERVPPTCDRLDGPVDSTTGQPCAVSQFAKESLRVTKTASPPDPIPGSLVTYTLTLENTGAVGFTDQRPAWIFDDLSALLAAGAALEAPPTADPAIGQLDSAALTATGKLSWSGPLAPGERVAVSYGVRLAPKRSADGLANTAWVPTDPADPVTPKCAGSPADGLDEATGEPCAKVKLTPPVLEVAKTSTVVRAGSADPPARPRPGDQVVYTLTVRNAGSGDYTAEHPAVVVDGLDQVLDDATWDGSQTWSRDSGALPPDQDGTLTWDAAASRLSWSGRLEAGHNVVITYSATLKAGGDRRLENTAWVPGDPDNPGPPPVCESAQGAWTACDVAPIPALSVDKSYQASPVGALQAGTRLTYTLTLRNVGHGDFTAEAPASVRDDLTAVLDDAVWSGLTSAPAGGTVAWEAPVLAWSGPLAAGAE
ncbi:MAG: isopeptide-forming domain-containing fimbrial protein, partial [Bifidobacteriaceae bacterium]|nr:isopeptide-forming domain-containing fimbrial protein [Bifidobacteriaceae bacterium]